MFNCLKQSMSVGGGRGENEGWDYLVSSHKGHKGIWIWMKKQINSLPSNSNFWSGKKHALMVEWSVLLIQDLGLMATLFLIWSNLIFANIKASLIMSRISLFSVTLMSHLTSLCFIFFPHWLNKESFFFQDTRVSFCRIDSMFAKCFEIIISLCRPSVT